MATRPNRLERITNLLLALLNTSQPLSLREIGASVAGYPAAQGALRQAFERDKRTLRDEGIPIATERIDGEDQVGYRILPEHYYLPDLALSKDEQEALAFALAAVRLDGGAPSDAGHKLGSSQRFDIPPLVVLPSLPALGALQSAISSRACVRFSYHGRPRVVGGYGLAFKEGSWYFVGVVDPSEQSGEASLRTFRVDRIEGEVELDNSGSYEIPEHFDVAQAIRFRPFAGDSAIEDRDQAVEVTIDVDQRAARRVLSSVGAGARIDGAPEGSIRLRFRVGDESAFVSWILGFGDSIEVLEPVELRTSVIDALHAVVRVAATAEAQ